MVSPPLDERTSRPHVVDPEMTYLEDTPQGCDDLQRDGDRVDHVSTDEGAATAHEPMFNSAPVDATAPTSDGLSSDGLSDTEVETTVGEILGSLRNFSTVPPRFALSDVVGIDGEQLTVLEASPAWKAVVPHVRRSNDANRGRIPEESHQLVPRVHRRQPGVIRAVRYWTGISNKASLTAALEEVRVAWVASRELEMRACSRSDEAQHHTPADRSREPSVNVQEAKDGSASSARPMTSGSDDQRKEAQCGSGADQERTFPIEKWDARPPDNTRQFPVSDPTKHATDADARVGKREEREGLREAQTIEVSSLPPADNTVSGKKQRKKRGSSPVVDLLGFAAERDPSSGLGRVALMCEWLGIGSMHDLLMGKTGIRRASQEDLIRWTRQAAQGLLRVCSTDTFGVDSAQSGPLPRVSTRSIYLFPKPKSDLETASCGQVLDAKVATFVGRSFLSTPPSADDEKYCTGSSAQGWWDALMPPESLSAKFDNHLAVVGAQLSAARARTARLSHSSEAADVWGIGTLVFELATARIAGPTPLALKPLRDLLRDVPIGPRFLYGDVARGIMRLTLQSEPSRRAGVSQVAAAVDEIAARTLRRAHVADDRRTRLREAEVRAAAAAVERENSAGEAAREHDKDGGNDSSDGYGQALREWNIKQAVERASGRARVFLRQLWFDSLSEDDKRRIRHRRRHRKANDKAREARRRRVRAAMMRHWTSVEVATWAGRILRKAEARGDLPLMFSGDAKGGLSSMADKDDGDGNSQVGEAAGEGGSFPDDSGIPQQPVAIDGVNGTIIDKKNLGDSSHQRAENDTFSDSAVATSKSRVTVDRDVSETRWRAVELTTNTGVEALPDVRPLDVRLDEYKIKSTSGMFTVDIVDVIDRNDIVPEEGSSKADDDNDWASVDAAEIKGYAGAEVELATAEGRVDGRCLLQAMEDAHANAEDALMRFVKSSIRLPCREEVEARQVELMVRELLTIRPYSTPSQLKIRALAEAIVRSAEAPRELLVEQIDAQLPALGRVLTAGYRRQAAMVGEGEHLAVARIQGLARGASARRMLSSIWRQAEEFAADLIHSERIARKQTEEKRRAREKEEALAREREEVERFRRRLVPRVSSVRSRGMEVSLPSFLVEATRRCRRFLVTETTVSQPPTPQPSSADENWTDSADNGVGIPRRIHVLLRQGSAAELKPTPVGASSSITEIKTADASKADDTVAKSGNTKIVRAAGDMSSVLGLSPSTTYRLILDIPPLERADLLQSARSLGIAAAIRSLDSGAPDEVAANSGTEEKSGVNASPPNTTSDGLDDDHQPTPSVHLDVVTLPDVPGTPQVSCKVLTSASAVDPRDPGGVLSLRQWQSPYPGVADMDAPSSGQFLVLAPGRPEAIVSIRWTAPEGNGLNISSYFVERRIGSSGNSWTSIATRTIGNREAVSTVRRGRNTVAAIPSSLDAVDTPLKTIDVAVLKKVAVRGLPLAYRVTAENALGQGNPSSPLEVNIHAFLGHLRAHAVAQQGASARAIAEARITPTLHSVSSSLALSQGDDQDSIVPLAVHSGDLPRQQRIVLGSVRESSATAVPQQKHTEPRRLVSGEQEDKQMSLTGKDDQETAALTGKPNPSFVDKRFTTATCQPSYGVALKSDPDPGIFGDDFLGLRSYGEERVHALFGLGESGSGSCGGAAIGLRAPAADGGNAGDVPSFPIAAATMAMTATGSKSSHLLPPIVGSAVSGRGRERKAMDRTGQLCSVQRGAAIYRACLREPASIEAGELRGRWQPNACGGDGIFYSAGRQQRAFNEGVEVDLSPTNEVFHAFLNLGRRLPGRLRRNEDGTA